MSMPPIATSLPVLLITDGKPGHASLSDGIVAALARSHEVKLTTVRVDRPSWLPPRALSGLTNARVSVTPRLLGLDLDALAANPSCPPRLVVSAGGDTLAANVFAARRFNCTNVFYGSLRAYRASDFTLVLTSYAEAARQPNIVMTLKPSALDPDTIARPPRHSLPSPVVPPSLGLLVGGDSGTIRWRDADWANLLALAERGDPDTFCLVAANSRRTPDAISDRLAELANTGIIGFIDVRTAGPGTLLPLFAGSDAILATIDSSSMISQAVWARRKVAVLTPAGWDLPDLERSYRRHLADNRWTVDVALAGATPASILAALDRVQPMHTNPLDDLAALLANRLAVT